MRHYHRKNDPLFDLIFYLFLLIPLGIMWLIRELTGQPKTRRQWYRQEYLQSPHWQQVRQQKLGQVGYRCQNCGRQIDNPDVHHLTYKNIGHENMSDLQVLCRHCHNRAHGH